MKPRISRFLTLGFALGFSAKQLIMGSHIYQPASEPQQQSGACPDWSVVDHCHHLLTGKIWTLVPVDPGLESHQEKRGWGDS